jgi:hypothetical protein
MADLPEAGVLFGQPVANLLEWAQVAANSDAFARATLLDYWKLLFGEAPRPEETAEFDQLCKTSRPPTSTAWSACCTPGEDGGLRCSVST